MTNFQIHQLPAQVSKIDLQVEHRGIQESKNGEINLTWSDINNMPYTGKVSTQTIYSLLHCNCQKIMVSELLL